MGGQSDGRFFDGNTAEGRAAVLLIAGDYLMITPIGAESNYWPLDDIAAAHDMGEGLLRLQCDDGSDARLIVENASIADALRLRVPWLETRHGRRHGHISVRKRVIGAVALTALVAFAALEGLPRLASYAPQSWLAPLGEAVRRDVAYGMGTGYCHAPEAEAAGQRLLVKLSKAGNVDLGLINLRFASGEVINAVAAPGGQLLAFQGLTDFAETPEAFSSVIAHELVHAVKRHPTRGVARSLGITLIAEMLTGGGLGATAAEALTGLAYTRAAEREADAVGRKMLVKSGIGTVGMASFFDRLRARFPEADEGSAILDSHPRLSARVEAAGSVRPRAATMSDADWHAIQNACPE